MWTAIAKIGGMLGGALLGNKLLGRKSGDEKNLLTGINNRIGQGQEYADSLKPQASNLMQLSAGSFQQPMNYWQAILAGDRSKAMAALAPELQRINQGYSQARTSAAELMPRGGSQASTLANLPYQQATNSANLLNTMRPQAAQSMVDVGFKAGAVGQQMTRDILDFIGDSNRTSTGLLNYELGRRGQNQEAGRDFGAALYDLLKLIGKKG